MLGRSLTNNVCQAKAKEIAIMKYSETEITLYRITTKYLLNLKWWGKYKPLLGERCKL